MKENKEKPQEAKVEEKKAEKQQTKNNSGTNKENDLVKKLDHLLKIRLDVVDPNKIDLEQLYHDNLPAETK